MPLPRRTIACAALLSAAVACSSGDVSADATARPPATAQCGEVELPDVQFGSHLIGDAEPPIPYNSTPPTSGWHHSGVPVYGVSDNAMTEPVQVTTLETGGVVVTHNGISDDEEESLNQLVAAHPDRVLVTPYDKLAPGEVVIAAWGVLQRCDGVDATALETFADAYIGPPVGS